MFLCASRSPCGESPLCACNYLRLPDTYLEKTVDRRSKEDRLTDTDRLRKLYQTHAHRVFAYAARRTDRDSARDVVSQTFLVAWRRIDELPDDPTGWLLGVARNIIANEHRAASRRAALTERLGGVDPLEVDPSDVISERMKALEALHHLGSWDREALMLMAWEQLDYKSAATVMGCSTSVFKIRLHRARRKLSQQLDIDDPPDAERALFPSRPQEAK